MGKHNVLEGLKYACMVAMLASLASLVMLAQCAVFQASLNSMSRPVPVSSNFPTSPSSPVDQHGRGSSDGWPPTSPAHTPYS